MPHRIPPTVLIIALLVGVGGCGPAVPDEELGRVVFEVPPIPEGYEPYELPDLTASPGDPPSDASGEPIEEPAPQSEAPGEPPGPPSDPAPPDDRTAADP
jgi:hypothetical protein